MCREGQQAETVPNTIGLIQETESMRRFSNRQAVGRVSIGHLLFRGRTSRLKRERTCLIMVVILSAAKPFEESKC